MGSFQLTKNSRIILNDQFSADRLEGSEKESPNFYDQFYASGVNPLRNLRINQYTMILNQLDLKEQTKTHLDIGCGDGLFVSLVQDIKKLKSKGIDSHAPEGKEYVQKISLENFIEFNREGETFDLISFMDVLEHFPDPSVALQSVRKIMNSDSNLLVKVPSKDSLLYLIAKNLRGVLPVISKKLFTRLFQVHFPPPHYYYFNLVSLEKLLQQNGYELLKYGYVSETPIKNLYERLWNLPALLRFPVYIVLFGMQILTSAKRYDGLYVLARIKKNS